MLKKTQTPWTSTRGLLLLALSSLLAVSVCGQNNRISQQITGERRFTLSGQVSSNARAEHDQGKADASLPLSHVTIVLQPSTSQRAALDQLLSEQQNPSSDNYHKWLTPEDYGSRFGLSKNDVDKVVAWLESEHLSVVRVARARNAIVFSGTAAQIGHAFHTEIHTYNVNGEKHYANATEPSLPVELRGIVLSIRGLHDFRLKPKLVRSGSAPLAVDRFRPAYTSDTADHYLAPDDFATIFDVQSLYALGIDGAGQKIAVVGQSDIDTSHLSTFRSRFGLSATNLKTILIPGSSDPGTSTVDAQESDLDLQWSSAVARRSELLFVYASDVMDAVQYTIDENLAPILSMSYGACEASVGSSDAATMQSWAQQANAEGMTWVAASGDSGAADCYKSSIGPPRPTTESTTLSTDMPASVPEVTGVGGTEFNEGSGTYWKSSNSSSGQGSALSYIPEMGWNDSSAGSLASSGGGASTLFSKPSWQTGTGVPNDGARDVPDIALPASAEHDGYMVYTSDGTKDGWYTFGGTSAGAPAFSGILALLNQYLVAAGYQSQSGLGNVNPNLYTLSSSTSSAFHDITSGNNIVSTTKCSLFQGCSTATSGYSATTGYDQVTGLGSPNAYNFVTGWHTAASSTKVTPTVTSTASPVKIATTGSTVLRATVSSSYAGTFTGTVSFFAGKTALGTSELSSSSGRATATLTIDGSTTGLKEGGNTVTATYSGDTVHNSASASSTVTVVKSSAATPSISSATNAGSYERVYAPGMIMALFGSQLALTTRSADTTPLPTTLDNVSVSVNGVSAPLYYISPTQLNVQIPYEAPTSGNVNVTVTNNKQTASIRIQMSAVAPGIFTNSDLSLTPTYKAARGETITLYFCGAGAVQPSVSIGATPSSGQTPVPTHSTAVTVGGVNAATTYIGIPSWSVGVVQVNFTVPSTAALGSQPVIVSVGGVSSQTATLTVTE